VPPADFFCCKDLVVSQAFFAWSIAPALPLVEGRRLSFNSVEERNKSWALGGGEQDASIG
jgi:hypothetical protein